MLHPHAQAGRMGGPTLEGREEEAVIEASTPDSPNAPPVLRPLGATELLDTALRAVWSQRRAVLSISVPLAIVVTALHAAVQYATVADNGSVLPFTLGSLLVPLLIGTVLAGLIAPAIGDDLLGRRGSARMCLRAVGLRAVPLVGLAVVVTLAEALGLVLALVGGVWLWGVWAVAAPALVNERLGVLGALRRSVHLVRGVFWWTWGVRALGWLVTYLIGLLASVPFALIAAGVTGSDPLQQSGVIDSPRLYVTILTIGTLISALITMPIAAAIDVLIYLDLRMRREGMDIVMSLPPLAALTVGDRGVPIDPAAAAAAARSHGGLPPAW